MIHCDRHVSSCDSSRNYTNQALDIMRDDDYNIYQITRYYGISLFNSCYYQQDYFRAVEMRVDNYSVASDGSVMAWVQITDEYFVIEDVSYMRSKRLKCSSKLASAVRYPLSWNCTDGTGQVVTEVVPSQNGTYHYIEIQSREGRYVVDGDVVLSLRCYDCQCSLSDRSTNVFGLLFLILCGIALILFLLDYLFSTIASRYQKKQA